MLTTEPIPSSTSETAFHGPLRVCLVSWAPFWAGAEVAGQRLALGLEQAGHQVLVIVGTDGEVLERMRAGGSNCRFVPLALTDKWRWWRYTRAQRQLRSILDEFEPDIVHSNDLPSHQMVAQAAGRMAVPRICHHRWLFEGPAIDWMNKYGAERHLFVSRALMDYLIGQSAALRASRRSVVHDGLPLEPAPDDNDRAAARRELGLGEDKRLVLFAGQIIERKGVADLLAAWARLPGEQRAAAELLLIGDDLENDGAYLRRMRELAGRLGCGARFFGFQRNVARWLTAADVVVVPSHAEPLGNATLEAMAYARPVIGSRVGGIPEMIEHEQTGLLVAPQDPAELAAAISRLLDNLPLATRLGVAARRRCESQFSLEHHVAGVVQEYAYVLRQNEEKGV